MSEKKEMTREEAIEYAESKKMRLEALVYNDDCKYGNYAMYSGELSFVNAALTALRPVSREQVEKVCGKWIIPTVIGGRAFNIPHCSVCNGVPCGTDENTKFCAHCGAPMTDEAVQMVMERLEALKDAKR